MNPRIAKNTENRNHFFKEPLFAKYPAAGQGERCRHKDNGKPADMAVCGKNGGENGKQAQNHRVLDAGVEAEKHQRKIGDSFFADRSILRSLLSRQKITALRRRPTVWKRMSKHFSTAPGDSMFYRNFSTKTALLSKTFWFRSISFFTLKI